jgi:uncharacterized protein YndB with AHSA1/START domain
MIDSSVPSVTIDHRFTTESETLWETLTTDAGFSIWSGPGSRIDPQPGGLIQTPDRATGQPRVGVVEEIDAGRHLRYRWWPEDDPDLVSTVDITLQPSPGETRLIITERLALPAPVSMRACARAWRGRASGLALRAHGLART